MKTEIFEFDSYRVFLKSCLAEKTANNENYSLRAMAKHCGVASSTLSEVINGRANLSIGTAVKIAGKLGLKSSQTKYFLALVQLESAKDPAIREHMLGDLKTLHPKKRVLRDLSLEQFKQMADWQHSALLELTYLKDFKFTAENAARKLRISKPTAELSLERLTHLELLEKLESGEYRRVESDLQVRSDLKNSAMREYYRQMMNKISQALVDQGPKERLSGYLNLPLNPSALPEIDTAIDRFINELKSISEKHRNYSEVYHLSLHLINLTKEQK